MPTGELSPGVPIEVVFTLGRLFGQISSWRQAMDEVIQVVRPHFVFDNLVVYWLDPDTLNLEVCYARATGRGKSAEADVAWGEALSNQVIEQRRLVLQEPPETGEDRLQRPYMLGLPLQVGETLLGAMIFIRFGGPPFDPNTFPFAEFLSQQLAQAILRERLAHEVSRLEIQYSGLQAQEDFISALSHEFRTPLGFIKGYTTTLLRPDTHWDTTTQREFLNIIDQETDRMQELIDNLLDSARLQTGRIKMNFQPVRLDSVLNDVIARTQLRHPELEVRLQLDEPLSPLLADPQRLAQVFENLLSNAVKYAPGSPVSISITSDAEGVHLTFEDRGPGIPEKYRQKIFERFFRVPDVQPSVHGTGLGLFICKQIVQAHQGQIWVESQPGQGTVFHIRLPWTP
ncbi:GAF domain-containing sensor histidine kinase [uncultured Thermanaerothrix sp.]|uniref:GAF domain-containing sensor histidine kinase n=1 Tax=uncultured Thermanaerothrix sp. TaxID=1195149 RepID=UPI0026220E5D|nr:GAF domain-containing sensor histidine kinase [uncultured Thermanaerothrix sp.]